MSVQEKTKELAALIASAAAAISESPMGYLIGMALMLGLAAAATRWDGHLYDPRGCVQVQEAGGRIFKVDTCTGKVEELPPSAETPKPDK